MVRILATLAGVSRFAASNERAVAAPLLGCAATPQPGTFPPPVGACLPRGHPGSRLRLEVRTGGGGGTSPRRCRPTRASSAIGALAGLVEGGAGEHWRDDHGYPTAAGLVGGRRSTARNYF